MSHLSLTISVGGGRVTGMNQVAIDSLSGTQSRRRVDENVDFLLRIHHTAMIIVLAVDNHWTGLVD